MPVIHRIIATLFLICLMNGCSSLPEEIEHAKEQLNTPSQSTLSELVDSHWLLQPNEQTSGVALQDTGWDALAQRLALVESAEQSIDIQYYIWNSDQSGGYLATRLFAAADRGVQVRVMLDDINLNEREDLLVTLDAHPNIEIRIFNPTPSRSGVAKWLSFLGDFSRLNRRMHNKAFIVDGALAVVGGRNIGDEYFDLSDEINFRDRDALVVGAVVLNIQAGFGEYWDSSWSYPVELLGGTPFSELSESYQYYAPQYKDYPPLPEDNDTAQNLLESVMAEMSWVKAHYIYDQPIPDDVSNTDEVKETAKQLTALAKQSTQQVLLESAYLVFDGSQLNEWQVLTNNGVEVKALTNSMVSNDLLTNHSAYAGRREGMLEHGVELFEVKPDSPLCLQSTRDASKCAPEAAYGLHTKTAVFDRRVAGIGSFNFNLRSTYLNTESVLLIEDQRFAAGLADDIEEAMAEEHSWQLDLYEGDVRWYSGSESWSSEPDTGRWERIQSRFLQLLPIEKYL